MGKGDFKGIESAKGGGLDNNPQNINRNGRPRKLYADVNKQLKDKGITPLTKEQLLDAYALVFNTDEEELKVLSEDKKVPYSLRLIIKSLNSKNSRDKALADYRDYMFGKAVQKSEVTNSNLNLEVEDSTELNKLLKDNNLIG